MPIVSALFPFFRSAFSPEYDGDIGMRDEETAIDFIRIGTNSRGKRALRARSTDTSPLAGRIRRLCPTSFVFAGMVELIGIDSNSRLDCLLGVFRLRTEELRALVMSRK